MAFDNNEEIKFTEDEINKFAKYLVTGVEPFEAARKTAEDIYGEYSNEVAKKSLQYARVLFKRDELNAKLKEYRDSGADMEGLPSKAQYARNLWIMANDQSLHPDTRHKYMQLYGQAMEYVGTGKVRNVDPDKLQLPLQPVYVVVEE